VLKARHDPSGTGKSGLIRRFQAPITQVRAPTGKLGLGQDLPLHLTNSQIKQSIERSFERSVIPVCVSESERTG
jgi:hypothetical protein